MVLTSLLFSDAMTTPRQSRTAAPVEGDLRPSDLRERWNDRYGPLVAEQLRADRRYTLFRVGPSEFAYTSYEGYVRALKRAWALGFVPEPLPSATGTDILDSAPNLRGVDLDLSDLRRSDVRRPPRFS
jgi:hypothetical protein